MNRFLLIGIVLVGATTLSNAFVIDTFSSVPVLRTDTTAGNRIESIWSAVPSAWLGSRLVGVFQRSSPIGGVSTVEVNGGWFGSNTPLSTSFAGVRYGASSWDQATQSLGIVDRNFDASGFAGVRVTIEAAQAGTEVGWDMNDLFQGPEKLLRIRQTLTQNITSTTSVDLLFRDAQVLTPGFSLTRIDMGELVMDTANVPSGGFAVSKVEFIPVPEPGTMIGVGAGLALLARKRSKRSA